MYYSLTGLSKGVREGDGGGRLRRYHSPTLLQMSTEKQWYIYISTRKHSTLLHKKKQWYTWDKETLYPSPLKNSGQGNILLV